MNSAAQAFESWLPIQLFAFLRFMDAEASKPVAGRDKPYGLNDYGRFARPDLSRPQAEVEWSCRLVELFQRLGINAEGEVHYPRDNGTKGRLQKCDIVLPLDGARFWIEVKGAWRSYWGGKSKIYRGYLLHPLVQNVDEKTHTVPFDLIKLSALSAPVANTVGQLLIGFESADDPMQEDIETLIQLADLSSWRVSSDSWDSASGNRVRCWFWWRAAGGWSVTHIKCNSELGS